MFYRGGLNGMNTEQLRYFSVLYNHLNYQAAAKQIPISTQGLIKAIRRLENDLDAELFTQTDSGALVPSPFADELQSLVVNWERGWQDLHEAFKRIRAQEVHEIRLGVSMGIIGLFGPKFLAGLKKRYPRLTVTYKEDDDEAIDAGLKNGSFDFALSLYPYDEQFVTTELFSTPIAYWVHKNDPLSTRKDIYVRDLDKCVLSWPSNGYKIFTTLIKLCEAEGVNLKSIYESEQMFIIYDFVCRGEGLGFTLPQIDAKPFFSIDENTVCVPSGDIVLHCGLSRLPDRNLTKSEQQFYDYCVSFVGLSKLP